MQVRSTQCAGHSSRQYTVRSAQKKTFTVRVLSVFLGAAISLRFYREDRKDVKRDKK
jgi:hypothetical protein